MAIHRSRDDWTTWALAQSVVGTRQIGAASAKLVLVALCQYASTDNIVWPSANRLAADLSMSRRDIRNGLEALENAGLITKQPTTPRAPLRWKLMAGYPADTPPQTGRDTPPSPLAGRLAGSLAGDMAGYPATNRREEKYPPTPLAIQTVRPGEHCADGAHKFVADGTCMRCDIRPGEAA